MATQGIVSVVVGNETVVKVIAGSEGMNARFLAAEIRREQLLDPEAIFAAAKRLNFGGPDDLVVQTADNYLTDADVDFTGLYLDPAKFADARFNPRWEVGGADYVEVVEF